jgi:hypothetical protein
LEIQLLYFLSMRVTIPKKILSLQKTFARIRGGGEASRSHYKIELLLVACGEDAALSCDRRFDVALWEFYSDEHMRPYSIYSTFLASCSSL